MNPGALIAGAVAGWFGERFLVDRLDAATRPPSDVEFPDGLSHRVMATPDLGVVHWIEAGSGRPVVLLHGITLDAEAWHHQFDLSVEARVMAIDLRGHGRSVAGSDGATITTNARDLQQLLVQHDLRGVILVGHSMGGMVIGNFLASAPLEVVDRVSGVAFVDSALRSPVPPLPGQGMFEQILQAAPIAGLLGRVPDSDLGRLAVMATFGRQPSLGDLQTVAASYDRLPPEVYWESWSSIGSHDVRQAIDARSDLDRLVVRVVVGSEDRLTPRRCAVELVEHFADAELLEIPDVGHQAMLEAPDAVSTMLRELLAATGGS